MPDDHSTPSFGGETLEETAEKFLRMQIEPHLVTSARIASLAALLQGTHAPCTLENCGHMRQLDAIVDLLGMPRGTRSVLDELRDRSKWEDTPDEWTEAIKAAFPTRSGSHDEYGLAMQMVGHRHSKGELVALVNWLLVAEFRAAKARLDGATSAIPAYLPSRPTRKK